MISASAQSVPSTRASALNLTRPSLTLTISPVTTIWSPGTIGRRKRALSMPDRNMSLLDGIGFFREEEAAGDLRHALDDQDAGHHRVPREVALEERLVHADVLQADDLRAHRDGTGRHLEDAVDEKERVAVRQEPEDLEDVGLRARFAHESPPLWSPAFSARRRTRRAVSGSRRSSIQDF